MPQPFLKFYPRDWVADQGLACCSLAAQGWWVRMIVAMHGALRYGYFERSDGGTIDVEKFARANAVEPRVARKLIDELGANGVFSRDNAGVIYSRRMVKDASRAALGKAAALRRYQPELPLEPSGSPTTQKADSRRQIAEPSLRSSVSREEQVAVWFVQAAKVSDLLLEVLDPVMWARSQFADIHVLLETYGDDLVREKCLAFIRAVATGALQGRKTLSFARLRKVWEFDALAPMESPDTLGDEPAALRALRQDTTLRVVK